MVEAKGHCSKIWNIYQKYLKTWFDSAGLSGVESQQLEEIFIILGSIDAGVVWSYEKWAEWLANKAESTLDLVDKGQLNEANQEVLATAKEILPYQRALGSLLSTLYEVQASFIAVSGAT